MTSTVYIAKSVYGGDGLGRLGDGRVVFVPGAWPGESVKAEIIQEKRSYVKARLVSIEESSPDRIAPDETAHLPGCVYSTLSYAAECAAKEAQLRDFLARARIDVPDFQAHPVNATLSPVHYRNKVVYHFAKVGSAWRIGYRQEPSHEILDIEQDPLAVAEINAKLPEIRKAVLALLTTGPLGVRRATEQKANLTIRWTPRTGVKWWLGDAPSGLLLKEETCGRIFEVPADGFYQVNPIVGEALVRTVVDAYAKEPTGTLLDLYCGVGVFGLCCRPDKLIGIESGRQAIDAARANAAAQGFAPARFFAEQVGANLKRIPVGRQTTIVVDPPRGGMEPNVPTWLARVAAPRLMYVSCDPATLTRDLKTLVHTYEVESVRWFNMFPRTARFETLVCLRRRAKEASSAL